MAVSPLLSIPLVSANQSNKEITMNDAINFLEKSSNAAQSLDFASADLVLPLIDLQRFFIFKTVNLGGDRTLTIPSAQRIFAIDNTTGLGALTVIRGGVSRSLAAGTAGVLYVDGSKLLFLYYSANGGSIPFTALSDVPGAYLGSEGKFLKIKADGTGLEFSSAGAGVSTLLDLSDVPDSYATLQGAILKVNAAGTGIEFVVQTIPTTLASLSDTPAYTGFGGYYVRIKDDESGVEYTLPGDMITQFTQLEDVPLTYVGQAGKMLVVDPTESGLIFSDAVGGGGGGTFLSLTDVDATTYADSAFYYVRVNAEGTAIELAPAGGELIDSFTQLTDVPASFATAAGFLLRVNATEDALEYWNFDTIDDLPDVDTTTTPPTSGQALVWSASGSKWVPGTVAGGGGSSELAGLSDVDVTTSPPSDGDGLAWDATAGKWVPGGGIVFSLFFAGVIASSELLYRADVAIPFTTNLTGSRASATAAATGSSVFSLQKNGTEFGTITFAAASASGVFAGTDATFAAGDFLTIVGPATSDATLINSSISLKGTKA